MAFASASESHHCLFYEDMQGNINHMVMVSFRTGLVREVCSICMLVLQLVVILYEKLITAFLRRWCLSSC